MRVKRIKPEDLISEYYEILRRYRRESVMPSTLLGEAYEAELDKYNHDCLQFAALMICLGLRPIPTQEVITAKLSSPDAHFDLMHDVVWFPTSTVRWFAPTLLVKAERLTDKKQSTK